jgi:hypothetical protein
MTKHMPPVPPANRTNKGTGGDPEPPQAASIKHPDDVERLLTSRSKLLFRVLSL